MAGTVAPNIVTDGLVLYLDAANVKSYVSGSTIWGDLSQGGNNGALINGPTFSPANSGGIVFDGVNDYCRVSNQTFNFTTNSSFTIEVVFKRNSSTPGTARPLYQMGSGINSTNARIYFFFDDNSNGSMALNYYVQGGIDRYVTLSSQLLDINYHHSVQVINKDTLQMTGYFDGVNRGSGGITSSSTSTTNFDICGVSACNASIAFIKIYNRALSATEVLQNYNATKTRFGL
jgi:hypothetical protein